MLFDMRDKEIEEKRYLIEMQKRSKDEMIHWEFSDFNTDVANRNGCF